MTTRPNTATGETDLPPELVAFMHRNPDAYDMFSEPDFTEAERALMDEAEAASRARQAQRRAE